MKTPIRLLIISVSIVLTIIIAGILTGTTNILNPHITSQSITCANGGAKILNSCSIHLNKTTIIPLTFPKINMSSAFTSKTII